MRFEKVIPTERLRPFIKYLAISESPDERTYKVLPSTGLVMGFQYKGQLSSLSDQAEVSLDKAGISGLSDSFKVFRNSANTGTILVYFTETGIAHFAQCPANELFNQSVSLDNLFNKELVSQTEEKLGQAQSDRERIRIVERFLLSQFKERENDKLIVEAVRLIYQSKGIIQIRELQEMLFISQSPFEKRFRKIVGTSPKKFASIVRFNSVLNDLGHIKSLTELCYAYGFFDQAHFIKDFKKFTGDSPEQFKRGM